MSIEERLNQFPLVPGFVCPAEFWPALGCADDARYIAIYWEQCGDEAAWADGRETFVGAFWPAYHALLAHNGAALAGRDWLFGSSEEAAEYWLVIDRETERAWMVPAAEAPRVLQAQWSLYEVAPLPSDSMAEWLAMLQRQAARIQSLAMIDIGRQMDRSRQRYQALVAALYGRDQETEVRP